MNTTKPNILFFLPDQHRPDWLGVNPDLPLRTPNLDQLCTRGTRFTNAYTPSPVCAPARACLASGMHYQQCRVPGNFANYPSDLPTYYQSLRDTGYRVCSVGKLDLHKDQLDWHLDGSCGIQEWGFTEGIDNEGKFDGSRSYRAAQKPKGPYLNYLHEKELAEIYVQEHADCKNNLDAYITALPDEAYCDNWLSENGLRFLRGFPEKQPWHLVVNFTGPHNPMDVTQGMHDKWQDVTFPMPQNNTQQEYGVDGHQRNRQHYAAMIENIDRQVGRFIEAVKERGELENTLIIYASDHGEMLGDHNRWGKSTWYTPSSGVPLIAAGPGISEGVISDALVSLHDLTATFLDYAAAPPLPRIQAESLRNVLEGTTKKHREYVLSSLGSWRMLFDGHYKLVLESEAPARLFDLKEDPFECSNRAQQYPKIVEKLRRILEDETTLDKVKN